MSDVGKVLMESRDTSQSSELKREWSNEVSTYLIFSCEENTSICTKCWTFILSTHYAWKMYEMCTIWWEYKNGIQDCHFLSHLEINTNLSSGIWPHTKTTHAWSKQIRLENQKTFFFFILHETQRLLELGASCLNSIIPFLSMDTCTPKTFQIVWGWVLSFTMHVYIPSRGGKKLKQQQARHNADHRTQVSSTEMKRNAEEETRKRQLCLAFQLPLDWREFPVKQKILQIVYCWFLSVVLMRWKSGKQDTIDSIVWMKNIFMFVHVSRFKEEKTFSSMKYIIISTKRNPIPMLQNC